MLRWLALLLFLSVLPAAAYEDKITTTVQEGMLRLGYDPGPIDGAWGGKTRAAMNELRAEHGLPPAQELSGSSLALIHRVSPGPMSLPKPGLFVVDAQARAEQLAADQMTARSWCPNAVGRGVWLEDAPPVERITTAAGGQNYITDDEDWYSPVQEGLLATQNSCMRGQAISCEEIIGFAGRWADADALRPGARPGERDFEDVSWIGNSVLRSIVISYGIARQFVTVDPAREASIIDWLKRRVDDYHYLQPAESPVGQPDNSASSNHALAHMSAAAALGVLVGDRSMMEPAFETWRTVLASMREDGSLPVETRRGARWLHYSTMQIAQLLSLAELAAG
jgi:poly(beta-D-mannuronate) lyase